MMPDVRRLPMMVFCAGLALHGCAALQQSAVSPGFFVARPEDAAAVQALIREQERQVQTCAAVRACDRAHYLRALVALYEDRRVAVKHFRAAAGEAPNGRYATPSLQWIRLLEDGRNGSQDEAMLTRAAERLVRDVLEHETMVEARQKDAQAVQLLKRQLKEREDKIDELTQQIEALKRVDQEVKDRVKPSRPAN